MNRKKKSFNYIEIIILLIAILFVFGAIVKGGSSFEKWKLRSDRTEKMSYFSKNILESCKSVNPDQISTDNNDFTATILKTEINDNYSKIEINIKDKMGIVKDFILISYINN